MAGRALAKDERDGSTGFRMVVRATPCGAACARTVRK